MSKANDENKQVVIEKLLKKVNGLLNEVSSLKSDKKDLDKVCSESVAFLKAIPAKNPIYKQSTTLLFELKSKLDKIEKNKI